MLQRLLPVSKTIEFFWFSKFGGGYCNSVYNSRNFRTWISRNIGLLLLVLYRVDTFSRSDQCRFASKLFSAYTEGDVEEIKRLSQSSTVNNLDHMVIYILFASFVYLNLYVWLKDIGMLSVKSVFYIQWSLGMILLFWLLNA